MAEIRGEVKQQYVASLFSRIADRYDLMNDLMTLGLHRNWKARTVRLAAQGLSGKGLDVAGGTGDLGIALARRAGIEHAVVLDLLPGMIAKARSKAGAAGLPENVTCLLGDALDLPFADDTFACCTAGFSLRNMPGPGGVQIALAEMVRVVRPGGRVAVLELTPMAKGGLSGILRWYFHHVVPLIGSVVAGDRAAYTYLPQSVDQFVEAVALAGMLEDAGLALVGYKIMGFGAVAVHWGNKP
ncbi:MAG: hypothetical protein BZY80_00365 [SAR202 cluster bacterium Io17-Chloro-G2]|nr:MAG: hypothetical protein BZY80_00365 [SAR202 cluster bacterium Io17-Chloro-G2]